MKKIIAWCSLFGIFIIAIVGFTTNKKSKIERTANSTEAVISCAPSETANAISFVAPYNPPAALLIRKNIYSLSAAEIASIKTGIAVMKALPLTNPTSWQYQAAIHGTTLANNLAQWNSCQHGTDFFYSWHRMYLYFFERILRAKSGNPNLTLPYWDYQSNPALPPAYRTPVTGNTLYDPTRNNSINTGGALPNGPMTSITSIMTNDLHFLDFNMDIQGPHGSIHGAIGGNMGAVNKAALDPCFWLHHTNIDRLWQKWLTMCNGRANPIGNAPWMTHVYTFFDDNGQAINMTGSQVLNTASQLNYKYDLPATSPCLVVTPHIIWLNKSYVLLNIVPTITSKTTASFKVSFKGASTEILNSFIKKEERNKFNFSTSPSSDKLLLKIDEIKIAKMPEGVIEVYVNLLPGQKPISKDKSFAGVLDLFSMTADHHQMDMKEKNSTSINITSAIKSLGLSISDLNKIELTFVSKGNIVGGTEIKTTNELQFVNMQLIIVKPDPK